MKLRLLIVLSFLLLTACPQAAQFVTPGSFDADKTTSVTSNDEDKPDDNRIDKATTPRGVFSPDAPPEAIVKIPPIGDTPLKEGGGSEQQMAMYQNNIGNTRFTGPIDPKNDNEGVVTGHRRNQLRYGAGFATVVPVDASVPGSGDPYPLEKGNLLTIKLLLEKAVVNGKDQYGNDTYGWETEQDGPQVRLWFCPAGQNDCVGSYADTKVALSSGGENVTFSNLPLGPGTISFWLYERLMPSPLPDWMPGTFPPTYQTTPDFHEGSLAPFSGQAAVGEAWYSSDGFGLLGSLLVSGYVDYSRAIRSFPQSAP